MAVLKSGTTIDGSMSYHKGNHTHEIHLTMNTLLYNTDLTSYVEVPGSEILWSPANFKIYSSINPVGFRVYFEVDLMTSAGIVYAELYNKTDAQSVVTLSTTSTSWYNLTTQVTSSMPTAEKTLTVRIKASSSSYIGSIRSAKIILI